MVCATSLDSIVMIMNAPDLHLKYFSILLRSSRRHGIHKLWTNVGVILMLFQSTLAVKWSCLLLRTVIILTYCSTAVSWWISFVVYRYISPVLHWISHRILDDHIFIAAWNDVGIYSLIFTRVSKVHNFILIMALLIKKHSQFLSWKLVDNSGWLQMLICLHLLFSLFGSFPLAYECTILEIFLSHSIVNGTLKSFEWHGRKAFKLIMSEVELMFLFLHVVLVGNSYCYVTFGTSYGLVWWSLRPFKAICWGRLHSSWKVVSWNHTRT